MTDTLPADEPVAAALHYAVLALLQRNTPDAHKLIDPQNLSTCSIPEWPAEMIWSPSQDPAVNLRLARYLIETALAEPGNITPDGYPSQSDVTDWQRANFNQLGVAWTTLGLVEEVGELARALLKREEGIRGSYDEWSEEVRKELGDIFIKLLDVAQTLDYDLPTVAMLRWMVVRERNFRANPIGHGLPQEDVA